MMADPKTAADVANELRETAEWAGKLGTRVSLSIDDALLVCDALQQVADAGPSAEEMPLRQPGTVQVDQAELRALVETAVFDPNCDACPVQQGCPVNWEHRLERPFPCRTRLLSHFGLAAPAPAPGEGGGE